MLNKSQFDWNDMQELQEIGLIALVDPEAVQRLLAHIPDANPDILGGNNCMGSWKAVDGDRQHRDPGGTSHLGRSKAP